MSWGTWHTTAPPMSGVVPGPAVQSAILPNTVNPAPSLLATPTSTAMPPGIQYTPEQWAQMQQQNWQQWAQWQQQYQQWHQQYGAEYQKSMNALSNNASSAAAPPPPPTENNPPPPPPPDEALKVNQYNIVQSRSSSGYSTLPPPTQQYTSGPPPIHYSTEPQNDWQHCGNKRPLNQCEDYEGSKRQMTDNQNQWVKQAQSSKANNAWQPQTLANSQSQAQKVLNLEELTEAEKKFDKEFAAWEAQFNKWKEQNANHPDKTQYLEYEKKWESWRNSLLDRREQMRKKRMTLQTSMSAKPALVANQQFFKQPPPLSQVYSAQNDQLSEDMFNKPPPTQNNEPLTFKNPSESDEHVKNKCLEITSDFLKSSSPAPGGIPGLDLVKEGVDQTSPSDNASDLKISISSKGPDLDAISKGINSILGDPKLLNMLSMVSQKQNSTAIDTQPKIPEAPQSSVRNAPIPSLLDMPLQRPKVEKSNQSYDEYPEAYNSSRLEAVNNFDDQTRMSFTNGPNDQEFNYVNNPLSSSNRPEKPNNFRRFAGTNNKHMFNNLNNEYKFIRNNSVESPPDTRSIINQADGFHNFNCTDLKYTDKTNGQKYENHSQNGEEGMDDQQWNEADEYEKYHNLFNEADRTGAIKPDRAHTQIDPIVDDEPLFVPEVVVDYEHKSLKIPEPEISLELTRTFDYRHKPVNRIPYPQRPIWLSSTLRNIKQFDPLGTGRFGSNDRTTNFEREQGRYFLERNDQFDRPIDDYYRYPRDKYADRNNWTSHDKDNGRRDYSPTKFRDTNYHQTSRNRYSGDLIDDIQNSERKLGLEDLSDDEWSDDKNYVLKYSPPQKTTSPDVSLADNSVHSATSTYNQSTTLDDLINPPGRYNRPSRIVIILRGPPGSGKTYLAKLIKDREVENGGSAPRILSLDDYFMVEHEREITEDGRAVSIKEMAYEYEAELEESYRQSLIKAFRKTITDGYFQFVVVDNVNQKVKNFGEMWSFAKQNGFQVYICQLDLDPELCTRRNIHHRSESYIEDCIAGWEPTPAHHPVVDPTSFLQNIGSITEVEMEEADQSMDEKNDVDQEHVRSKWDAFDCSLNNLARLDGVSKPLRSSKTMEDYLQLDEEWEELCESTRSKQKRVRWADLEEQKQQRKMKALGFVIGQTDWKRIMDPTNGESVLTKTKYIEGRFRRE